MGAIPFTQKMLLDWAGQQVFREAQSLFERGAVQIVSFEPPFIRGTVSFGERSIKTESKVLDDGTCESLCPCRDNVERGVICAHVIALGLALVRRATDPEMERKHLEEARKAARLAKVKESAYLRRVSINTPGAVPARLRIELAQGWKDALRTKRVPIVCTMEYFKETRLLDEAPRDAAYSFSGQDEAILYVLEDISEGPAKGHLDLPLSDFINLLELCIGKPIFEAGNAEPLTVNAAKMSSVLRMDLDRENGEILLMIHTELPFVGVKDFPIYFVAGKVGWAYAAGHFWPLAKVLPAPLLTIYEKPISVERESIPRFLQSELPLLEHYISIQSDLTIDLFTIEPEAPKFKLSIRGSPASIVAHLDAVYRDVTLVAGKGDPAGQFAHPDPVDFLRFTIRSVKAEQAALKRLEELGFKGEAGDALSPVVGCREVLNFFGRHLPALRRLGWDVAYEGRIHNFVEELHFATPVVQVADVSGQDWFDVNFHYDDGKGGSISPADIQRAMLKGESYLESGGRTILIDANAIESMNDIFSDCASGEGKSAGSFRLNNIYSSYIKSSLDALDGIDVEATNSWRTSAERQNRELAMEPVQLNDRLQPILRSYQKEGVSWLRFLEVNGFCGILADEMGLGKTLQTLAWIELQRHHEQARGKPALIVCPTSLVENWAEEAARFVPNLKVLMVTGSDRQGKWAEIGKQDLVITSYALIRRDIEQYVNMEFSVVVLDEAQHIKNRSTQNAIAAKRLKGVHHLVLTGTPIENSVSDLWSIMDFLMPGYLSSHENFRQNYELPISHKGREAEVAQTKLRRKLHPFLMRRLKRDVAKDLPDRIEKLALCTLSADQLMVYQELLAASQRRISNMVEQQGFNRSRMEILKTLMRLRQTCCHLDLLKLPDLNSKFPSAKLDLFFELLDEAIDGGHRVLVFSQFVSMLTILRAELDKRNIGFCYLDGATQERLQVVHQFNADKTIPVFLISLKAGGSGLNLTGADMVIHFDPWWNPAVEDQATDRAHRIGQKRTVYSVKLIARGTVEEKVLELQKHKKSIIDATLETDEQVMNKLTWDDVRELLSL